MLWVQMIVLLILSGSERTTALETGPFEPAVLALEQFVLYQLLVLLHFSLLSLLPLSILLYLVSIHSSLL